MAKWQSWLTFIRPRARISAYLFYCVFLQRPYNRTLTRPKNKFNVYIQEELTILRSGSGQLLEVKAHKL